MAFRVVGEMAAVEGDPALKVTAEATAAAEAVELPFMAPELGEELLGLATIVLNVALIGVDEEAAPAVTGELVDAGGGEDKTGDEGGCFKFIALLLLLPTWLLALF